MRPSACAARFSEDISDRCINSPRLSRVPGRRAERTRLPTVPRTSSCETSSGSSRDSPASTTTRAVISLVMEAIGSTASGFLLKRTSSVCLSMTSATLDFRSSGSAVSCSPVIWPTDGARRTGARALLRGVALRAAGGRVLGLALFLAAAAGLALLAEAALFASAGCEKDAASATTIKPRAARIGEQNRFRPMNAPGPMAISVVDARKRAQYQLLACVSSSVVSTGEPGCEGLGRQPCAATRSALLCSLFSADR